MSSRSKLLQQLSPQQTIEFARQAVRLSPLAFGAAVTEDFQHPPHIRKIARALKSESKKIIITMPPRHGKSYLSSILFPAWYLGLNPTHSVMFATYGQELATDFGRKVRNLMGSEQYRMIFPGVEIARDSSAASHFATKQGGQYFAAGVGGPLTGRGASMLLADDLFKNRQEASSPVIQERTWDWFTSTFLTRRAPDAKTVVIGTRWSERDVIQRLIDQGGWEVLHLPAIDENGNALWPERFPIEALNEIRKDIGEYEWNALYQGRPVAREGTIIKREWLRFYKELPDARYFQTWWISCDLTFKDAKQSDFVVMQVWARSGSQRYLVYQIRERMGFTATIQAFRQLSAQYPQARRKLVEAAANGEALMDSLKAEIEGIIGIKPKESKDARLSAVSTLYEAGNVLYPDPSIAPWITVNIEELCGFPNAANDDTVDATSQALSDSKALESTERRLSQLTSL